jgi:hypothetical protein
MLILAIAKPCDEKWEEMTPTTRGAFCANCRTTVIDFTRMTDEETLDYFQKKKGEPGCGRFRRRQLNRPLIEISPSVFMMRIPYWKKFLAALLICFSSFITACSRGHEKDYTQTEAATTSTKENAGPGALPATIHERATTDNTAVRANNMDCSIRQTWADTDEVLSGIIGRD